MDKFEQFINKNKAELDSIEEPETDLIWMGIYAKLSEDKKENSIPIQEQKKPIKMILLPQSWAIGIAAAILVLIGISIWMFSQSSMQQEQTIQLADYLPEIAAQEKEFQRLITQKESELDISNINQKEYQEIFLELQLLDEIRGEYLKDVPSFNQKDQLVEVLLKYYERKIRILERLSNEIEKKKKYENYKKETSI